MKRLRYTVQYFEDNMWHDYANADDYKDARAFKTDAIGMRPHQRIRIWDNLQRGQIVAKGEKRP